MPENRDLDVMNRGTFVTKARRRAKFCFHVHALGFGNNAQRLVGRAGRWRWQPVPALNVDVRGGAYMLLVPRSCVAHEGTLVGIQNFVRICSAAALLLSG